MERGPGHFDAYLILIIQPHFRCFELKANQVTGFKSTTNFIFAATSFFFVYFRSLPTKLKFYYKQMWGNIHIVRGFRIWTHNLEFWKSRYSSMTTRQADGFFIGFLFIFWPLPASFSLFSSLQQLTVNIFGVDNILPKARFELQPLVFEVTALPAKQQPLPNVVFKLFSATILIVEITYVPSYLRRYVPMLASNFAPVIAWLQFALK